MTLRIKEIAKAKKIRMEDLAETMGINKVSLSRMINGNPTVETLEKIAAGLGVNIKELFVSETGKAIYEKTEDGQYIQIGTLNK